MANFEPSQVISLLTTPPTVWALGTFYAKDRQVINSNGDLFISKSGHTSTALDEPGIGANTLTYWNPATYGLTLAQNQALNTATTLGPDNPPIVKGDSAADISITGSAAAATGNAATATKLATDRDISGSSFDGSASIEVLRLRPVVDSVTALQFQQADGTPFVYFDSTNKRVGVDGVPATTFHVFGTSPYLRIEDSGSGGSANLVMGLPATSVFGRITYDVSTAKLKFVNEYPADTTYGIIEFQQSESGQYITPLCIKGGNVLIGTTTSSAKLYVYDNTTTAQPVFQAYQDNSSNTNAVAVIKGDGTGDLLQCIDGSTTIFRVPDGGQAAVVAALSTGGAETNVNICTAVNALLALAKNWNMMASA